MLKHTRQQWTSRHQRKGRHHYYSPHSGQPRLASNAAANLARMVVLEYWNISWWVAMFFTVGSVAWVINGFFVFLPFGNTRVSNNMVAIGWTAWLGATLFEVGSLLLILEAWNRDETTDFGWGLNQALHHKPHSRTDKGITTVDDEYEPNQTTPSNGFSSPHHWIWCTTDRKYWHELGFLASVVQLCAASIFWISGFTGLPEVQTTISTNSALLDGIFWTPQVIGGSGFIISSILYMLETQKKWYLLAPSQLGWHIGFWNLIGAIGFTLCGAFGYSTAHSAQYQSTLSTFWGSWAFLIGSCIQWYEAVNPVVKDG